jgi:hypothetical protein
MSRLQSWAHSARKLEPFSPPSISPPDLTLSELRRGQVRAEEIATKENRRRLTQINADKLLKHPGSSGISKLSLRYLRSSVFVCGKDFHFGFFRDWVAGLLLVAAGIACGPGVPHPVLAAG